MGMGFGWALKVVNTGFGWALKVGCGTERPRPLRADTVFPASPARLEAGFVPLEQWALSQGQWLKDGNRPRAASVGSRLVGPAGRARARAPEQRRAKITSPLLISTNLWLNTSPSYIANMALQLN